MSGKNEHTDPGRFKSQELLILDMASTFSLKKIAAVPSRGKNSFFDKEK